MQYPMYSPPRQTQKRNSSNTKRKNEPLILKKKEKNKSVELEKRKRKVSIEVKTKFKISSDHMGFLIEEQKTADLIIICSSVALNHYYETLMSLFAVIYSSSQIITSNIFDCQKQTTGLSGLRFVGVFFSIYEIAWNESQMRKLKTMAKNVIRMGSTTINFEQKIQFICRKIALNFNMRKRIEMAFLNTKLDSFWGSLINRFQLNEQIEVLDDLYETAPQRMAYWDFTDFVNNYLANENFYDIIRQSKKIRKKQSPQLDSLPHNFTYEFIIIEIFCFHQEECEREENREKEQKNCQLI